MSTMIIKIDTGNAAFDDSGAEAARILREIADKIEAMEWLPVTLQDVNGNKVGSVTFKA